MVDWNIIDAYYKKFMFNSMFYLQILCNYLGHLLAIFEWKMFQSKFYTIFLSM